LNPTVSDIPDATALARGTQTVNLASMCSDPESLTPLTYEVKVNNTLYSSLANPESTWFSLVNNELTYNHAGNADGGTHSFVFKCTDNFG
jgi:hypothetical protein